MMGRVEVMGKVGVGVGMGWKVGCGGLAPEGCRRAEVKGKCAGGRGYEGDLEVSRVKLGSSH